jgi:Na+/melibiose symporter-like transporter
MGALYWLFVRQKSRSAFLWIASKIIDLKSLRLGFWINVLLTLASVHSLIFSDLHLDFFLRLRHLTAHDVQRVHAVYMFWNPINDILAGWLSDSYVNSTGGTRLDLLKWLYVGWAATTLFTFSSLASAMLLPISHYAIAIFMADGFSSVAIVVRSSCVLELTSGERERIQVQRLNSVFGNVEFLVTTSALVLWPTEASARSSLDTFRLYLFGVCCLSAMFTFASVLAIQTIVHENGHMTALDLELTDCKQHLSLDTGATANMLDASESGLLLLATSTDTSKDACSLQSKPQLDILRTPATVILNTAPPATVSSTSANASRASASLWYFLASVSQHRCVVLVQ